MISRLRAACSCDEDDEEQSRNLGVTWIHNLETSVQDPRGGCQVWTTVINKRHSSIRRSPLPPPSPTHPSLTLHRASFPGKWPTVARSFACRRWWEHFNSRQRRLPNAAHYVDGRSDGPKLACMAYGSHKRCASNPHASAKWCS